MKNFILLAFFPFSVLIAQIVQVNNPYFQGGSIKTYARNSECVIVGTKGGIFRTMDNGNNWENITGNFDATTTYCSKLVYAGGKFFAMSQPYNSQPRLYKSENNGQTWDLVSGPFSYVQNIGSINNTLFVIAQSSNGYIYTTSDGVTWQQKAMLWQNYWEGGTCEILSLNSDRIFIILNNNVLYTTDGNNLDTVNFSYFDPNNINFYDLHCDASGNLYCLYQNVLFKYNFNTKQWNDISTSSIENGYFVVDYSVTENNIFLVTLNSNFNIKMYRSSNMGNSFSELSVNVPIPSLPVVENIIECNQNTFIGNLLNKKVVYSQDGGNNWYLSNSQYISMFAGNLTKAGNSLFIAREIDGIIKSEDAGLMWFAANDGLSSFAGSLFFCNEIASVNDVLFSISMSSPFSGQYLVYKYNNETQNWQVVNLPVEFSDAEDYYFGGVCGNLLFVNFYDINSNGYKFIITNNNGDSWISPGSQVFNNKIFFAGTQNFIFAFSSSNNEWEEFNNVSKVVNNGSNFIDISNGMFNQNKKIKRIFINENYKGTAMMDIDDNNNYAIFVVVSFEWPNNGDKLYKYDITNNTWNEILTTGLPDNCVINYIKYAGNNIWLLATNYGIYKSTDGGFSWTLTHNPLEWPKGMIVNSIVLIDNTAILGTLSNGIWKADNILSLDVVNLEKLNIYPNPACNYFIINSNNKVSNVKIYDIKGKSIVKSEENNIIDVSGLPAGYYILMFEINGKKFVKNFIKY